MSFTISYLNPPCNGQDLLNKTDPAAIGAQNNNFTVSQSMAGIVNSAALSVSGVSSFADVATFSVPPVLSGASIALNSVPSASIVNKSLGDAQLTLAGVSQSSVAGGYVNLSNAQTKAGVLTLSDPPVMSGASVALNSVPAASIVNKSLGDAQLTLAGVSQSSVAGGYVSLNADQSVSGVKTFSGVCSFPSGVSASTFTGALAGNASSATLAQTVNILTDNTAGTYFIPFLKTNVGSDSIFVDDATTPLLTYNPSTGALNAGSLVTSAGITGAGVTSSNGLVVSSGNISLQSGLILPVAQTPLSIVSGAVAVNLNNLSFNEFILPSANFSANITSMTFTNVIVNSKFYIYIQGGAANRNINKALNSGTVLQVNSLAGNTQIAANSVWRCSGTVLTPTLVSLEFNNFT